MSTRFKPPKRGTVFRNKRTGDLAVYTGRRRVYRHDRGMLTVYCLQAVWFYGQARATSYELTKDGLTTNWEPRLALLQDAGSVPS